MHFQDNKTIKSVFMKLASLKQCKIVLEKHTKIIDKKRELTVTVERCNEDLSLYCHIPIADGTLPTKVYSFGYKFR